MAVVPRRLDQQAPDMEIPGARDATLATLFAARAFAGHESQIRHQRARRAEATEVVELGHQADRRDGVDAAEAAQPRDGLAIRLLRSEDAEVSVHLPQSITE